MSEQLIPGRNGETDSFSRERYNKELRLYGGLLLAAISVSHAAGGIKTPTRNIRTTQIFTRMLVTAYTFFRLLPGNPVTQDEEEHWDWPTIASVARNLLEAYLHFYYLGVDDISEEEIDFRLAAMWFHMNSEKYLLYKSGLSDSDLTDFEKNLPIAKRGLRDHLFFKHLTRKQQGRVLSGRSSTYMTKAELMKRLPLPTEELSWMYRHLSNEVHSTAFAFSSQSNERGRGDENDAERGYIISAIWLMRKYLAAAVVDMSEIFPNEIGKKKRKEIQLAAMQLKEFLNGREYP